MLPYIIYYLYFYSAHRQIKKTLLMIIVWTCSKKRLKKQCSMSYSPFMQNKVIQLG